MVTTTPLDLTATRHSLEPACGLPSPTSPSRFDPHAKAAEEDGQSLISCMSHLSVCSLPPPPPPYASTDSGVDAVKKRFPDPPAPRASSPLASRSEQRRIYLGPKLSDRATGGPDAGPLIERFSCLFKDRQCSLASALRVRALRGQSTIARQIREASSLCTFSSLFRVIASLTW